MNALLCKIVNSSLSCDLPCGFEEAEEKIR